MLELGTLPFCAEQEDHVVLELRKRGCEERDALQLL